MVPRDWTPVGSSNISAIKHDGNDLYIEFTNGRTYRYEGVPEDEAVSLLHASSHGKHFHQNIKDQYTGTLVG